MNNLTLREVDIAAAGRRLLARVGFRVEAEERVAVVGPSGSGKTTLLRAIAGLVDPAAGEIRLDERSGSELGWPRWRRQVTYLQQQPVMTPGTVQANLGRPFRYGEEGRAFDARRARSWLDRLGLGPDVFEQVARTLSVGQQQRVALVRALQIDPRVVLLDEPAGALDAEAVQAVEELVAERTAEGMGAVVVTHDRAQAERWCDRVVDLRPHLEVPAPSRSDAPENSARA